MGHVNQVYFLARHVPRTKPFRIVEIGSKDYGSTIPWRDFYKSAEYIGTDAEAGKGVDVVCDLTQSTEGLPNNADLVICCSVLEHVKRPWEAAARIESLLEPGGVLYVSVPWVQRFHGYPDDYWRFTFNGIRELFPRIEWGEQVYSTNVKGDFHPAEPESDNALHLMANGRKYLPYLELHSIGVKRPE